MKAILTRARRQTTVLTKEDEMPEKDKNMGWKWNEPKLTAQVAHATFLAREHVFYARPEAYSNPLPPPQDPNSPTFYNSHLDVGPQNSSHSFESSQAQTLSFLRATTKNLPAMVLESGLEKMTDTALKDTSISLDEKSNMFSYAIAEAERDTSYWTVFEDEVIGWQLEEPDYNRNYLNGTIAFDSFSLLEGLELENFSCPFKDDLMNFDCGSEALDLFASQVQKTSREIPFLLNANSKNPVDLVEGVDLLECGKTPLNSEEKAITLPSNTPSASASDKLDSQDISGKEHMKRNEVTGSDSFKGLASLISEAGDTIVQKRRTDKPMTQCSRSPQEQGCSYHHGKFGACYKYKRDKPLALRSLELLNQEGSEVAPLVCESLEGSPFKDSYGLQAQKGRSDMNETSSGYDSEDCHATGLSLSVSDEDSDAEPSSGELEDTISEDDHVISSQGCRKGKRGGMRWTLPEVMKLIEGVSEYGVGNWIDIEKHHFSSSRRTTRSLQDKWNLLVKASSKRVQRNRKVRGRGIQLPESALLKVKKLAAMYPRQKNKRSRG